MDPRQLDDASDQFKTMVSEKDSWAGAIVDAIAFAGYVRLGNAGGTVGSSASRAAATEGEGWVPQLMQQHQAGSAAKTTPVWPKSVEEMNAFLRMEGKAIPDTLRTSGRNKTVWNLCDSKITLEQHPYDVGAPAYHTDPHWHLDTPGMDHVRYLPGDPIPGY